jgi:hypothetical protein
MFRLVMGGKGLYSYRVLIDLFMPLPDGVMVAQQTLDLFVKVQVLVGQPFDSTRCARLAHGKPAFEESRVECPEQRSAATASKGYLLDFRPPPADTGTEETGFGYW